jgi:hypothetical protein
MRTIAALAMILAVAGTTGCNVESNGHGDNKNVKVATPFGGMQVRTNESAVLAGIGLPTYPGATIVKKNQGDDGAADINMSFGNFQFKVKAVSYRTPDSPEKVLAFYKKALDHFGSVIECHNNQPVGTPTHTDEGLACDKDHDHTDDAKIQLKVGSERHQHIVGITPDNGGSKLALVSLDLPGDLHFGNGDDDRQEERKQ